MTFTSWLTVVSVCLLGAMSPGPSLAVVLRQTFSHGRKAGVVTAIAHGLGFGLYALLCVSGIAVVIIASPVLFTGLQWLGAGFLLWLGVKGLLAKAPEVTKSAATNGAGEGPSTVTLSPAPSGTLPSAPTGTRSPASTGTLPPAPRGSSSAFRDGFLIVFLNPQIAVFLIAVFSQVIGSHTNGVERLAYAGTAMFIDMGWYLTVAWLFSNPRWLNKLQKKSVWLERAFGIILIALAARLLMGV